MGASLMLLLVTSNSYLDWFLNVPDVDLAPEAAFWTAMLTGVPLNFALRLDTGAVHKKLQRPR